MEVKTPLLRVGTLNVHGFHTDLSGESPAMIAEALVEEDLDVFGLQEFPGQHVNSFVSLLNQDQ